LLDERLEGLSALFELAKAGTGHASKVGCAELEDGCAFDAGKGGESGLEVTLAVLGLAAHVGNIGPKVAHLAARKLGEHCIEIGVISVDVGHFEESAGRLQGVVGVFGGDEVSEMLLREFEIAQMKEAICEHELCVAEPCARCIPGLIDHLSEQDGGGVPITYPVAELRVCDLGDCVVLTAKLSDCDIL
jgi:hypothetical protein